MIAQIMQSGNAVLTTPSVGGDASSSGWTLIASSDIRAGLVGVTNYSRATLLYKIALAGDVAATNFSFTLGVNSNDGQGAIIAFSGVDNLSPFDVTPGNVYTNINNDQTLDANTITTTTANSAVIMFGAVHDDVGFSNWTTTNPAALSEIYDQPFNNSNIDTGIGAAWATRTTAGATGSGSATVSGGNNVYNGSILISLRRALPTITGFGANNGCAGGTITINGTNLTGATAANVRIGGTAVSSITSNTATQIVAVIGSGTTGAVTVTNSAGTATSTTNFTINPQPTVSNAGSDQAVANASSFTLAANTATVGAGVWNIVSGPSTALTQFSSTTSPTATFTPAIPGTYVLNWTISNSCNSTSDQVVIANNCVTNLITSGDFTGDNSGWIPATTQGNSTEIYPESIYFGNSNNNLAGELDRDASLRQLVTVIPGVSYTVSFRYARRPTSGTPATTGVTVKVTGGTSDIVSSGFTTTNTTSQVGSFTFTPTSSSVGVEFYNTLHGNITLGTIINDIVLLPASQANPYAVTDPKGNFNTTIACAGVAVQLDVENAPASGATYLWTGTGGAVFSAPNSKRPTITFSGSGLQEATVTVTSASGCAVTSTTYINVTESPVITAPVASSVCSGSTYSSGAITSTGNQYSWSRAGVVGVNGGVAGPGGNNINKTTPFTEVLTNSTNAPINVTYVLTPRWSTNSCAGIPYNLVVTVDPTSVGGTVAGGTTVCTGTNSTVLTLSGHTGSIVRWESSLNNFSTAGTPISNTTTTLTATNLTANTSYRAVLQSGVCATANSVSATVIVNPASVGGTVAGGTTVCTGTNSTVLTLSGHTGSIVRWESSLNNFSTAGTPISNTTTTLTATNLTANTSYRAVLQSGVCATANSVSATVIVNPASVGGIVAGGTTVCTGTNSTVLTLSGHTGNILRWDSSLDNFATAGIPISNTTTTLTATNLTATTSYRAVLQSGVCATANSASATVTVNPASVGGTVSGGTTVCTGTNSTVLTLSGHTGNIVRWESSLNNFSTAGTPISNTTTTLTATNLTATTSYRAVLQSGVCIATNSTSATITVNPASVGGAIVGSTTVCTGTNSTVLTLSGHIGNIIRWESSLDNFVTAGTVISNTTTTLTATSLTATTSYRAVLQSGVCATANSTSATIIVNPALSNNNLTYNSGTLVQVDGTVIEGGTVTMNTPAGSYFSTVNFASYGTPTGTAPNFVINPACHSTTSQSVTENYLLGNSTATVPASNGMFGDPCSGTQKRLSVSASYTQPICSGTSATIIGSVPAGGNGTYTYEWFSSTDGVTFARASGTYNGVNYTSGPLTQNTYYRRVVTSCTYTSTSTIVLVKLHPVIANNILTYSNGTSGDRNTTTTENSNAVLTAPTGTYFTTVNFASYGTPSGTYPNFSIGSCHSINSQSKTEEYLLGNNTSTIAATNTVFGDPCIGATKSLYVLARYAQPICSGTAITINGSTPTGGNGTYTYEWQSSTNATTGFTPISGSNSINYTSGALTQTTYFRRVVTSCLTAATSTSPVVMVIVNPRPTVTNTPLTQTICSGNNSAAVTLTSGVSGTTFSWTATATSGVSGFTVSGTGNIPVQTISTTATTQGTITYVVTPTANGCVGMSSNYTILIDPTPSIPAATVTAQPNCSVLTGSITLGNLPSTGTINQIINGVTTNISISGGGNQTITGLAAGSYTFTVSNGGCTSGASTPVNVVAFSGVIATWNGSAWSPGAPGTTGTTSTTNTRVEFTGIYNSSTNIDACACYVKNNAVVTFNPAHTLNVINEVVVESGSLTFENNASLVQHNENPNINLGNIIYKRITAQVNRYDYTYWSSPVTNMTLGILSPTTFFDKYFSYNNAWVPANRSTSMIKGKGYIVRAPQSYNINGPAQTYLAIFTGVPHNGLFTLSGLAASQAHLLGNPYPSAIDADVFLNLNSDINVAEELRVLEGTLYFWTHNTPPSTAIAGDKKYNYTTNDYATYNRTGGVGTAAKVHSLNYPVGTTNFSVPTGNIAAGQGFFAPAKAGGNVVFNNTMRISGGATGVDNSQFFKLSSGKTATTTVAKIEKNRIWLNLTNSEGAFKQTLIGYITGATNEYDGAFDGVTYNGNVFVDFYSVNNEVSLAIQGRALPFVKKDSVALGYRSTIIGDFQINIDQTDGVLSNQNVFLEDKDLKVLHDLKKEAYTFSTEKGTFNNRFVLRYVDKNAVDEVIPEVPDELNKAIVVALNKNEITIKTDIATIDKVFIYDSAGKKLYQKNKVDAHVFVISHLISSHQVLVVDIVLSDGTKHSRKIIY